MIIYIFCIISFIFLNFSICFGEKKLEANESQNIFSHKNDSFFAQNKNLSHSTSATDFINIDYDTEGLIEIQKKVNEFENPLIFNSKSFYDQIRSLNNLNFIFIDSDKLIISSNHEHNPKHILKKREILKTFELYKKKDDPKSAKSIYMAFDNDTHNDLTNCKSQSISLENFQLKNLGTNKNPKIYLIYFAESQYEDKKLKKKSSTYKYTRILKNLEKNDPETFKYATEVLKLIRNPVEISDPIFCHVQQIYVFNKFEFLVTKDGLIFGISKTKDSEDEISFVLDFEETLAKNMKECESRNVSNIFTIHCCKHFSFKITVNKFFPGVFVNIKSLNALKNCLDNGELKPITDSLKFSFNTKKLQIS
ncbi:hypothetical protein GVAV_000639 [Gurleya vavrai]